MLQNKDGPGAMYLAGTPDGSVPGIFYANVLNYQDLYVFTVI